MRECETTRHRRGVVLTSRPAGGMVLLLRDLADEDLGGKGCRGGEAATGGREDNYWG